MVTIYLHLDDVRGYDRHAVAGQGSLYLGTDQAITLISSDPGNLRELASELSILADDLEIAQAEARAKVEQAVG